MPAALEVVVVVGAEERGDVGVADQDEQSQRLQQRDQPPVVGAVGLAQPLAMSAAFGAGTLSSLLGIGGGILVVPSLNSWCGVPMRVAAATSAFMIGITAIPGAIAHYHLGYMNDFRLPAAAALGVLIGYRLGVGLGQRTPVRGLKLLMAGLLSVVALRYLF